MQQKKTKIIIELLSEVKRRLERQAKRNGRAMMREAEKIISEAVNHKETK